MKAPDENGVENEQCDCVQCPEGLTAPGARSGEISVDSCADKTDGDAYCYSQVRDKYIHETLYDGLARRSHYPAPTTVRMLAGCMLSAKFSS